MKKYQVGAKINLFDGHQFIQWYIEARNIQQAIHIARLTCPEMYHVTNIFEEK
jgi:hypothetical protein